MENRQNACNWTASPVPINWARSTLRSASWSPAALRSKAPPNPTIREFSVELGRLAGFQPSKRQPLPGIRKLWSAWTIFAPAMLLYRDFKTYGTDDESSVGN